MLCRRCVVGVRGILKLRLLFFYLLMGEEVLTLSSQALWQMYLQTEMETNYGFIENEAKIIII